MTSHALPLLAQTVVRTTFEWGRIQSNTDWVLPIAVTVGVLLFVRLMYRKDAEELGPALGWLLTALRSAAMLALLILYLQPQWRTEQDRQVNSRAVLLVDNSLSMGLTDAETSGTTRAGQVIGALEQSPLLENLRKRHDVAVLRFSEGLEPVVSLEKLGANGDTEPGAATPSPGEAATDTAGAPPAPESKVDWKQALAPVGGETRLGQTLRQLIHEEHNSPVAGIIVLSDGGQNAGISPETAIAAAREAKIPIFAVGVGSDRKPANVRVSDFIVPVRAYPGDQYSVTGYLQAQRMAGQNVTVELYSKPAGAQANAPGDGTLVESRQVTLGGDGEVLPVRFDLSPKEPGRQTLTLRVASPPADREPADNHREADVEIVDRKNRVLLLAGGPMREYRFLGNQLHRDASTTVDVLLQTARPGISQDANAVLDKFPDTRETMF
ncbi:MAG: VWA domain-containing protein, partial [Planctomycetia bacterium]|nr:VWA domain-containing protein [Planctomycetia bacterium]